MELTAGQIVISRAGRDINRAYMVLGEEGRYVLLANGDKWTIKTPKRKNARHLNPTKAFVKQEQRDEDQHINAAIMAFLSAGSPQGG